MLHINISADQDYAEAIIFQDDFESYEVGTFPSEGGWYLTYDGAGPEYQIVTSDVAHSGSKSFQLVGQAWWSACADKDFSSNAEIIGFEAFVMVNDFGSTPNTGDKTTAGVSFVNRHIDTWGRNYGLIRFKSDGKIYAVTAEGWRYLQDFSLHEWYKVRVTVDKSTDTFNVWINGQLKASNLKIEKGHATEIAAFGLGSGHAGATVYFDDIKIFEMRYTYVIEFFVPYAPESIYGGSDAGDSVSVIAFYDDTEVKVDTDGDGTFEFEDILTKGELKGYSVTEGAYIMATKQVSVIVRHFENDYGAYDDGLMMYEAIPVCQWGTDYWIPEGGSGLKIIASRDNTEVILDSNADGIPEQTWTLNRGQVATYSNPIAGTHVTADKPVMLVVYNAEPDKESGTWTYTVFPTKMLGTEYYFEGQQMFEATPTADQTRIKIVTIEDQTNIAVDTNGDGVPDLTQMLNKGETLKIEDPQAGLKITSDKKIGVAYVFWKTASDPWTGTLRDYTSAHALLPVSNLGTEYTVMTSNNPGWAPQYINEIRIVAVMDNTEVKIDLDWDDVYEFSKVLNAGEAYQYVPPWITEQCWTHVISNNPIIVVGVGSWNPPPHIDMKYAYVCAPFVIPPKPGADFKISVSPDFQSINPGETATYTISVTPLTEETADVFISSEWIGEPPSGAAGVISPTKVTPPAASTLTITTSPETPLGQYTVKIKATSGSITHSVNITLQVGFAVEIKVEKFHVLRDLDPTAFGWADVYFNFSVQGIDDDIDGKIDEVGEWFRAPRFDYEIQVGDEDYLGPIYIPFGLVKLPFDLTIKATDSDLGYPENIGYFDFIVDELPWESDGRNSNINFEVSVRELTRKTFSVDYTTEDEKNPKQWYWFEVEADKVWKEYRVDDFNEVVVAVIDTGVDYTHPDIDDVMWINEDEIPDNLWDDDWNGYVDDYMGYDFLENDPDPAPYPGSTDPRDDHGTFVAGIIAAEFNKKNDILSGIAGIARNVKIMNLRVGGTRDTLLGPVFEPPLPDKVAKAIRYAVDNGAKIISMSLGGYGWNLPILRSAVHYAYKKGAILICAAGNDRTSKPLYPASFEEVISVTGTTRYIVHGESVDEIGSGTRFEILNCSFVGLWGERGRELYEGSNYGPSFFIPKECVELCAPSNFIWSIKPDSRFDYWSGTSFAAPMVSAAAALIIGYAQNKYPDRSLTPNELRLILRLSATDLGPKAWDPYYGFGLLNVYNALKITEKLLGQDCWQIRLDPPANLDLHIYDSLGRHVGLNYDTSELELEIPGAVHTGDETDGFETIFLPANLSEFEIRIIAKDINESVTYSLEILLSNETGAIIGEWNFTSEISQGETRYYSVITPIAEKPTIISWEYVFEDVISRNTTLKISIEDHYFQLITPDKVFSIRNATKMLVTCKGIIAIFHRDNELELFAIANTRIDFCFAYAKDIETHKRYLLIDKPGKE